MTIKKVTALLLALVMVVALAACGGTSSSSTPTPAATAAPAASSAPASSAPAETPDGTVYKIIVAESGSENTSNYAGHKAFKDYVEEKSGGRLIVEIYPNAQLGADREAMESTQLGQIIMMSTGLTQNTNFVPDMVGIDLPFYYTDKEQVMSVFSDEKFLEYLRGLYADASLYLCAVTFQGFRTLTSNVEIHSLADCKGIAIRVVESPTPIAIWSALGANPTPLAFSEVYTALQQGVVDAEENPTELIYSQKFYEQQKYIIDTNHQIQPNFCVMNLDFYNSLPDDLKTVVGDGFAAWAEAVQAYTDGNLEMYDKTFTDYGCTMIQLTDDARKEFTDATAGVRDDISKKYPEVYAQLEEAVARVG